VAFSSTVVCATFGTGQLAIFASGSAAVLGGEIVLAAPYSAAPQLQNAAAVAGKVVVMQRGGSTFQEKAVQAQAAGAVGAIIVNNSPDDPLNPVRMNISVVPGMVVTIPVVMVSQSVDVALQASQGLRVTIRPTPSAAGTPYTPLALTHAARVSALLACCVCDRSQPCLAVRQPRMQLAGLHRECRLGVPRPRERRLRGLQAALLERPGMHSSRVRLRVLQRLVPRSVCFLNQSGQRCEPRVDMPKARYACHTPMRLCASVAWLTNIQRAVLLASASA
jgi:hypothetical protein